MNEANEGLAAFTEAYLRNWYSTHNFKIDANVAMRLTPEKPSLNMPGGSSIKVHQNAEGAYGIGQYLQPLPRKGQRLPYRLIEATVQYLCENRMVHILG